MLFVVHCLDHAGKVEDRLAHYDAHKSYLAQTNEAGAAVASVISGPLLASDHETMIGSLFIVEADSEQDVQAFSQADSFNVAGIWESVEINPFNMRVDNRR